MEELKIKDLRVGNMVSFTDFPALNNTIVLNRSHLYNERFVESFCKPIPLNEEWLVKFGFTQQGRFFNKEAKHNLFVWYENHIGIKGMLGVVKPSKCIYVHQLQNLYFALTQKELTIKWKN